MRGDYFRFSKRSWRRGIRPFSDGGVGGSKEKLRVDPVRGLEVAPKKNRRLISRIQKTVNKTWQTMIIESGPVQGLKDKYQSLVQRKDTFLYGQAFVEEQKKRLFYCPVHGFIESPKETAFNNLLRRYEIFDSDHPRFTKCVVGAACALAGELVVQKASDKSLARKKVPEEKRRVGDGLSDEELRKRKSHQRNRLWALPLINVFYVGYGLTGWVKLMAKMFPKDTFLHVTAKTVVTSIGLSPLYTGIMVGGTHALLANNREVSLLSRRHEFESLCITSLICAPGIYAVQFFLIPMKQQVMYLVFVNFCFNVYASVTLV